MKIADRISVSFLILTIFLTICASSIFYLIARDNLKQAIYTQLDIDVNENAQHIQTYLELAKVSIGQFSKSVVLENYLKALKENSKDRNEAFDIAMKRLRRTKDANPEIFEFLLLDSTGRIVASSNEKNIGLDKSTDAIFAGGQNNIFLKDAYHSDELRERLIAASAPILDSRTNDFLGVLVARIKFIGIDNIVLESPTITKSREVYIVNKYGYMITPSRFLKNTFLITF